MIRQRLREALDASPKYSAASLSLKLGRSKDYLRDFLSGEKESIGAKETRDAEKLLGLPNNYLTVEVEPLTSSFDPDEDISSADNDNNGSAAVSRNGRKNLRPGVIPEFDLRGGASYGGGYALPDQISDHKGRTYAAEAVKAEWTFPEAWLRNEMRLTLEMTDIIAVDGPSMLPDLAPGDRVLIDRSNRDPRQDAIFAVRDGDSVIIKHVQLIRGSEPPRIVCTSSNQSYKPFELILDGEQAEIIGRVAGRISRL